MPSKDPPKAVGQTFGYALSEVQYSELLACSPLANVFASKFLQSVQSICGRKLIAKPGLLAK